MLPTLDKGEVPYAMAHHSQRLDFGRLADHLADRGRVDADVMRGLLEVSSDGCQPFPQALVESGLLSDWDLAKSVCEAFQLAFVPVEAATPNPELLELFDEAVLREHGLVPLARFGAVVTMIMPGLVEADTLAALAAASKHTIQPVVGTVQGNEAWLAQHLTGSQVKPSEWGSLFDQGDAAVNAALDSTGPLETPPAIVPETSKAESGRARAQLMGDECLDLPAAPAFESKASGKDVQGAASDGE